MKKHTVIQIGEDRRVDIRSLPEKLVAVVDAKMMRGWLLYRGLLQRIKGIGEVLVVTERDAIPQSPYVDTTQSRDELDLNTIAAAGLEWEAARVNKYNANYQISMAIKWVVIMLFAGLVIIALLVAAGKIDVGAIFENWKSSIGGK